MKIVKQKRKSPDKTNVERHIFFLEDVLSIRLSYGAEYYPKRISTSLSDKICSVNNFPYRILNLKVI